MMKHEFEEIAGYEVSTEDYNNIIEPMYMALPGTITKAEFVKMIDKKRFALKPISKIVKEMKQIAKELKETCTHYTDYEKKDKLEALVKEYMERKGYTGNFAHSIHEEMRQTCYYPTRIDILSTRTYKDVEEITLI